MYRSSGILHCSLHQLFHGSQGALQLLLCPGFRCEFKKSFGVVIKWGYLVDDLVIELFDRFERPVCSQQNQGYLLVKCFGH
jgi:hypothetical protein